MTRDQERPIEIADPFARRLLSQYLERRRSDVLRLRRALADDDYAGIQLAGHNLSGSGAAYGLERISQLGGALESAAQTRQPGEVADLIDQLEDFVTRVVVA